MGVPAILVNNAGFGNYGLFAETDRKEELDMIQVNITALTDLTKLFLPDVKEYNSTKNKIKEVLKKVSKIYGGKVSFTNNYAPSFRKYEHFVLSEINNVNIKNLSYCSQALNESDASPIGTRFGTPIYPYTKTGIYYNFKIETEF